MRKDKHNVSLFWHGFFAKLKMATGLFFILMAYFTIFITSNIWFNLGGIIIGIILVVNGGIQHFDFKRRSGYIVYGGDGF